MIRFIGERVNTKSGMGTITAVEPRDKDYNIIITLDNGGTTIYRASMVKNKSIQFVRADSQQIFDEVVAEICKQSIAKPQLSRTNMSEKVTPQKKTIASLPAVRYEYTDICELVNGVCYGKCARDIYDLGVEYFFWHRHLRNSFIRGKLFYAEDAAEYKGDSYSVWFLAHSNLTRTTSQEWANVIYDNSIEEEYLCSSMQFDAKDGVYYKAYAPTDDKRIVFIKNADAEYIFCGVYQHDSALDYVNARGNKVAVYVKIANKYSLKGIE